MTLVNILFENIGLPPINDNIFIATENRAFSSFYLDKSKGLLAARARLISGSEPPTVTSSCYSQHYCSCERLDYLNKFFSLAEDWRFRYFDTIGKVAAQLEFARRMLYAL